MLIKNASHHLPHNKQAVKINDTWKYFFKGNCVFLSISFAKERCINWSSSVKKGSNLLWTQIYKVGKDYINISIEIKGIETKRYKAE